MVRLTRIYTRSGDQGGTTLGSGRRVAKQSPRVEAYGTVDEVNACLGVARLHVATELDAMLARIQNDLFDLGADLCVPEDDEHGERALRITADQVARLESEIDTLNADLPALESFVLPGGTAGAAHLHHARTVVRRAERLMVDLAAEEPVNPEALKYVNRLSDHLFVAARAANAAGGGDVPWRPGGER